MERGVISTKSELSTEGMPDSGTAIQEMMWLLFYEPISCLPFFLERNKLYV